MEPRSLPTDANTLNPNPATRGVVTAGCVAAMASAIASSVLLFANGSFVLALLVTFRRDRDGWLGSDAFAQVVIYTVPLALLVVQWLMIDYVRTRLRN